MWRKKLGPARLGLLVAHGQVQQDLVAGGGDAPSGEHGLLGAVAAKGLEDRVDEQVGHVDLRQVAGAEGLVVLPQAVGDLAHGAAGEQQLPVGTPERILDVAGGQPPRVHLHHEPIQRLGVAGQELDQLGAVGELGVAHLRHPHADPALGGAKGGVLVAVSPALAPGAALVAATTHEVGLLLLEPLLYHVPHAELAERGQDVRLGRGAAGEQLVDLLAHDGAGRYSPHGLGLLSVDFAVIRIEAQAASHLQER